jgi:hypothetical protein
MCNKGNHCNFINKLCTLKHSLDKRIRGYINPNLVCDRRICKGFDINTCTKLHDCDYDACMKHAFTFRIVQDGIKNFMENILPKMNVDRIMKKMGLPIINQLAPPMDSFRSRERHRSRSPERRRSRSPERHSSRYRSRSRDRYERRDYRHRSRSRERRRSRSRDRFFSESHTFHRQPEAYQRLPEFFQRPHEAYLRPHEAYLRPPEAYQRPPEVYQRPPEDYQRPPEPFQRQPEPFYRQPIHVALSSDPPRRIITIQPKQTDIHSLLHSAIKEGKDKIINFVNDFESKCRNVPSCYLHNFKACKFMHKDQINECMALFEATKNIKLVQDLAKKMTSEAQNRFRNSTPAPKKNSNGRYFESNQDFIPLS